MFSEFNDSFDGNLTGLVKQRKIFCGTHTGTRPAPNQQLMVVTVLCSHRSVKKGKQYIIENMFCKIYFGYLVPNQPLHDKFNCF